MRSGGKEEGRKEGTKEGRTDGRKEGKAGRKATLIKSRNRQLAGGEILYENNVQKFSLNFRAFKRFKQDTFGRGSPQ